MPGSALWPFFQLASLFGSGLTAVKLFRSGLYRRYRVFFWYFVFRVPYSICALIFPTNSTSYFWLFVICSPLNWVFYILVVRELVGLVLEKYKGLYTLGRWAMYFSLAVSVTLSILTLLPRFRPTAPQRSKGIPLLLATDRGVTFGLAIFLVLMLFFVSRYPVSLGRNVVVHTVLYTTFFLSNTLSGLLKSVFGLSLYTEADTGLIGVASACVFAWFFLLSPQGEEVQVNLPSYGPESEKRILLHLDALNRTLLKVSRK
jgi:hypothetical protein